jgi:hypothetical protein
LLVALLGAQVGESLAEQGPGAVAIMVGEPLAATSTPWKPPAGRQVPLHGGPRYHQQQDEARRSRKMMTNVKPARFWAASMDGVRIKDVPAWIGAIDRMVHRKKMARAETRWMARRDWNAVPLLPQPAVGPIGVYVIDPTESA